jgi:3-oxoacyl-[acyl-carrier protein] reductase
MSEKRVMVTGARGGIGKALILKFAEAGYDVIACNRDENADFTSFLQCVETDYGIKTFQAYFNLADVVAIKSEAKRVLSDIGNVHVLVNNAGVAHGGLFAMTKVQTIRDVFEINLFSYMELTQVLLRPMMRQKAGCIINMSSIAGIHVRAGNSAYGVSKAAVKAWTETLAAECAPYGIRVNAIAPSLVDTNMAKQMESKAGEEMIHASAMDRLAKPDEVANVAVFLASENASFINGQTIIVNGGGK